MSGSRRIAHALLCVGSGLGLFACDRGAPAGGAAPASSSVSESHPPAAVVGSPPAPAGVLRQKLIGTWAFEASPATRARMVEEFKRSARDPEKGAELAKRFEEGLSRMTLEITADAMITKQGDGEVGREGYEVLREDGPRLTVRMATTKKEQVLDFKDDGTIILTDDKMGEVSLRRR